MVVRWQFYDPVEDETWTVPMNPSEGGTPGVEKNLSSKPTTAPDGAPILTEGQDAPKTFEVKGTILEEDHLTTLKDWVNRRHAIQITDDLGRVLQVYLQTLTAERQRAAQYRWKHTFTLKGIVLSES